MAAQAQVAPVTMSGKCWNCCVHSDAASSLMYLRVANIINAIFVVVVGIVSLLNLTNVVHISYYAVSVYLIGMGLLLCCFEMRIGFIEARVRKNFGFMYTFVGRTLFLAFVASLCFGLSNDGLNITCGVVTAVNALYNGFIVWRHERGHLLDDPTHGYQTSESLAAQYVRDNPDLANRAVSGGAAFARDNPQVAQAGMQYARDHPDQAAAAAKSAYGGSSGGNAYSVSQV